jgi:integrase
MSVRKREWTTTKGEAREAWVVDYVDGQRNRHIRTFERKKDADAHEATVRVDVSRGIHTSSKVTVAEAGAKWLDDCEGRL